MTVRELVDILSEANPDSTVKISLPSEAYYRHPTTNVPINDVRIGGAVGIDTIIYPD